MSEKDSNELNDFVAARLKRIRKQNGIRLKTMAHVAGTSYTTVQKYESGENRIPIAALHKFAKLLGVNIGAFFPEHCPVGIKAEDLEFLEIFKELRQQSKSKEAILRYFSVP